MDPERTASDGDMPPGTSRLLSESETLILVPEPTNDPNDPLNWSNVRKAVNVTFVYALTIAIFTVVVIQTVFWPQMTVDLELTYAQLNAGLACNIAGLAVGCFFIVPFTKKYGRRSTYVVSTAVLAGSAWWSSRMNTAAEVYITNLILGLAGSSNETIAEMTIADMFFVHQRGLANGLYIIAVMLGNTLIPTIAGVQAESQGWRWSYYTVAIVLSILTVIFLFFFEETKYVPVCVGQASKTSARSLDAQDMDILKANPEAKVADTVEGDAVSQVASRTAGAAEPPTLNSYRQRMRLVTSTPEPLWGAFVTPFKTASLPHIMFTAIQCANAIFFLVLLSSVSPIVFSGPPYNFGTAGVGLMLVGPFIGNLIGSLYGGIFGDWLAVRLAKRNNGIFEPEFRLYVLALPAVLMGAGLVVYGVTLDRGMHWIYPSIGGAMYSFSMGAILDMCFTVSMDAYTEVTADSFVLITFIRNAPTIALPFGIVPWLEAMSLTHIFIICGCISSAIAFLFIPMIIYGKAMRKSTQNRYEALRGETAH